MRATAEPDDALGLAGAIRAGATTAVAAIEAAILRAQACAPLGAVRHLAPEIGLARAGALPAQGPGPFHGVPFLMKDLGSSAKGFPLVCGSRALSPAPAAHDSDLSQRFWAAGLVPFGVTTSPEFGLALSSEPAIGPIARNPLDPRLTPGGSSGGAAAAVAAGVVAVAHATDAGGSTRVPAACCGLVGLKPTRGAIPGGPGFTNHISGLAAELIVSRSLRDTAAALDAFAGRARGPFPDPDLGGPILPRLDQRPDNLTIGFCAGAAPGPAEAVRHAAEVLARAGCRVVEIDPARLQKLAERANMVFDRVISVNLARSPVDLTLVEPLSAAVARRGRDISARDLAAAEMAAVEVAHAMWGLFEEVDALVTPMLSGPPLPIGAFPLDHEDVERHWKRMADFAPYACIANVAGTPALSIPHGEADRLPLAAQLVGPMGADGLLLRLARVLQDAAPWRFAAGIAGWPS